MTLIQTLQSISLETRKNLLTLFIIAILFWLSITALLPTLPTYVQEVGGNTQQVGLVMGSFAIGLLLSRTWLGRVADNRGRKLVILIGTSVAATAPLGYLLLASIPGLMSVRAYHGISIAAFTTGYSALVVDLAPVKHKGEIIGYMTLAMPVGMAVGPAVGGFIQEGMGNYPLFVATSICGLGSWLLTMKITEKNRKHDLDTNKTQGRSILALLQSTGLIVMAIIMFLIGLVFGNLVAFMPLFIKAELPNFNPGIFYTAIAIASFSSRVFVGRVSDLYGRGLFISLSLCFYIISMSCLSLADSPVLLILGAIFEGAGAGILIPMIIAMMSDRCDDSERGRVFSLCIGGFDVGIALAGPIFGFIATQLGYRSLFMIAIGLVVLALLIFICFSNKKLSTSYHFALGKAQDLYAMDLKK